VSHIKLSKQGGGSHSLLLKVVLEGKEVVLERGDLLPLAVHHL